MRIISRIKNTLGLQPIPIYHGHVYTDFITGERFVVKTVGRWVEIERLDAERRPEHSVRKQIFQTAISAGLIDHEGPHEQ